MILQTDHAPYFRGHILYGIWIIATNRRNVTAFKELIDPEFLTANQVRMVDTHTPPDWYASRSILDAEHTNMRERLEQLRAMGYIAGPGEEGADKAYEGPADSDYYEEYAG